MGLWRSVLVSAFLAGSATLARAGDADQPPVVAGDPHLHFGSVSVYSENDKYFAGTDQHYTNGFKLSFLSTNLRDFTGESVPWPVRPIAQAFGRFTEPDAAYKLNLSLGQNIYTPEIIHTAEFQPKDRPYAAWLYVGAAYQNYLPERTTTSGLWIPPRLDVFEITAGTVGPSARGREIQNGFHDIIGVPHAEGWTHQIKNEVGVNLVFERKYRVSTAGSRDGLGADLIPHAGFSAGNIFTYANLGLEVRTGWKLPDDFGTNLIRPSGDSNSAARPRWNAFFFGALDARAVARDITLDGNTFRESPHIGKEPFVADWQIGFALGLRHFQITYSQAVRTREFKGQHQASVFGSISGTFYY